MCATILGSLSPRHYPRVEWLVGVIIASALGANAGQNAAKDSPVANRVGRALFCGVIVAVLVTLLSAMLIIPVFGE